MKVKDLLAELKHYNPEMEVNFMYPGKEECEFISLNKMGLFKGVRPCFYVEAEHTDNTYLSIECITTGDTE